MKLSVTGKTYDELNMRADDLYDAAVEAANILDSMALNQRGARVALEKLFIAIRKHKEFRQARTEATWAEHGPALLKRVKARG